MNLILVGHTCSPERGSEAGLTWNWAWHLAQIHKVWVLTHPIYQKEVESFLDKNPSPNLNFEWVELPAWCDPWRCLPRELGIRLHYLFWQHRVLARARRLLTANRIQLVHHVSYGTISAPSLLWRLPVPFVWGPIGGGQVPPPAFRRYFGKYWVIQILRKWWIRGLPHRSAFRKAIAASALLLSTNPQTTERLKEAGAVRVIPMFDNGIASSYLDSVPTSGALPDPARPLTLLWAGKFLPLKALPLALEAIARIKHRVSLQMLVAGAGPLEAQWKERTRELGVEREIHFLGLVAWREMPALFRRSDVFLFTSLRDSSGSVVLEAMACGVPVIVLNLHAAELFVPNDSAIKVPAQNPEETIEALGNAILQLAGDANMRRKMGEAGKEYSKTQRWENRAALIGRYYQEIVQTAELDVG